MHSRMGTVAAETQCLEGQVMVNVLGNVFQSRNCDLFGHVKYEMFNLDMNLTPMSLLLAVLATEPASWEETVTFPPGSQ